MIFQYSITKFCHLYADAKENPAVHRTLRDEAAQRRIIQKLAIINSPSGIQLRRIYAMVLALIPVWSFAAGYGGAEGRNRLGERIYIASDSYHELYVIKGPNESDWSKPFDMNTACPEFSKAMEKGVGATFSCPSRQAFPLSGTTYRISTSRKYRPCSADPFYDKTPGIVYLCVKGCDSKTAPAIFKENPWECD